jgi:hypothetical protein
MRVAAAAGVALLVLATAWVGRIAEGTAALAQCDAAMARGDAIDAILFAHAAAEARCPGCSAPDAAFAKLEHIATNAELRGDEPTAFSAWRAARAAALAASGLRSTSARRERAEVELARIGHRLDVASTAAAAAPTPAAAEPRLRATLAADAPPSGATYALVGVGGVLFLVAAARFAAARGARTDLGLAATGASLAAAGVLLF